MAGMTLIETLVALVISVIVMAIVFTSLRTVHRVMSGQQGRSGRRSALRVLNRLSRELSCAVATEGTNSPTFQLTRAEDSASSRIEFCTASHSTGFDVEGGGFIRKLYCLEAGNSEFSKLVCRSWPIRGSGSLGTGVVERVVSGVRSFEVAVLDGDDWLETWEGKVKQPFPVAVRIGITVESVAGAVSNSVMILIPVSLEFHSSIERGSVAE